MFIQKGIFPCTTLASHSKDFHHLLYSVGRAHPLLTEGTRFISSFPNKRVSGSREPRKNPVQDQDNHRTHHWIRWIHGIMVWSSYICLFIMLWIKMSKMWSSEAFLSTKMLLLYTETYNWSINGGIIYSDWLSLSKVSSGHGLSLHLWTFVWRCQPATERGTFYMLRSC